MTDPEGAGSVRRMSPRRRGSRGIGKSQRAAASLSKTEDATAGWLRGLLARAHYNVMVVALAAKLARIAWATLRKGASFERRPESAVA